MRAPAGFRPSLVKKIAAPAMEEGVRRDRLASARSPGQPTDKHPINRPYQTFMSTIFSDADGPSSNRVSDPGKNPGGPAELIRCCRQLNAKQHSTMRVLSAMQPA